MSVLAGARIVLGVSGSIAAYKAAELASTLTQAGAHVDVALTRGAEQFVAPMTFEALSQRAVVTADTPMTSEHRIAHVEVGRAADVIVIAPATASAISRLALGLAEDIVTEIALVSAAPVVVAPAMEPGMLAHPATQANLSTLRGRGVHVVPPAEGRLASGATGQGRLPATEVLVDAVRLVLGRSGPLAGRSIVVSAGGTREFLDPVRYLGNRATGRQGVALSRAALERGAAVQLVLGAAVVEPPYGVAAQLVDSADAMLQALRAATQGCDALIMNAAVGDFRPTHQATAKIKRRAGVPAVPLTENPSLLAALTGDFVRVAFAAETEDHEASARAKLHELELDAVVVNDVTAFEAEGMAEVCASSRVGVVLMHMRGNPRTMQKDPTYDDVVGEIRRYLRHRIEAGEAAGVDRRAMAIDPGIGFGKTIAHNLALLNGLPVLAADGVPVLVGTSRKAFLGALTGRSVEERDVVTAVSSGICAMNGASIVRVHDVATTRDALALADAMVRQMGDGDEDRTEAA